MIESEHMVAFKYKLANPLLGFWGKYENNIGMKKGYSPTCKQNFVLLAPLFVPLFEIISLCLLENSLFLN